MARGGGEESALLTVGEIRQDALREPHRRRQVPLVAACFIGVDQAFGKIGIVFQVGIQVSRAGAIGPQQSSVSLGESRQEKLTGSLGSSPVSRHVEHPPGFRHGADHHSVPGRDDLVIESGRNAFRARRIEQRLDSIDGRLQVLNGQPQLFRHQRDGLGRMQHILVLPVAARCDIVIGTDSPHILFVRKHRANFLRRPDEEFPLHPFGVGIGCGIEPALGRRHFLQNIVEGFTGHATVVLISGHLKRFDIDARQQGVVVQHLLEMRHQPPFVGRIAREAAPDLIVDPAGRHGIQRGTDHRERMRILCAVITMEQQ